MPVAKHGTMKAWIMRNANSVQQSSFWEASGQDIRRVLCN
jgi:hypothetical protein